MAAAKYNITIEQGATFSLKLTIKSPGVTPTPIDITSWAFAGQVRSSALSSTILATFTFTILNQITNTGEVLVTLSETETAAIPATCSTSNFAYDIEATVSGAVKRLLQGTAIFSAEVTR